MPLSAALRLPGSFGRGEGEYGAIWGENKTSYTDRWGIGKQWGQIFPNYFFLVPMEIGGQYQAKWLWRIF